MIKNLSSPKIKEKLNGAGKYFVFFILICAQMILNSCNYTHLKKSVHQDTPLHQNKNGSDLINYSQIYNIVIDKYCIRCHRSGDFPLRTYKETVFLSETIRNTVFVLGSMPKFQTLPDREKKLLLSWLDAGTPEFSVKQPIENPENLLPTYSSIRDNIFKIRCGNCHNPKSQYCLSTNTDYRNRVNKESCRIELENFSELINGDEEARKELILPGSPDESQLIISIERTDENRMPPAEDGFNSLEPNEIKIIREWISKGALNN